MSNRIGRGARRRRQDAHRIRINNMNSDRFEQISAIVSETGEIDLIKTYTTLLTSGRFDEIDRIIASFHNDSFVLTLDVDTASSDPHFVSLKDEIDVFYKNDGRAKFIDDSGSIPCDSYAIDVDVNVGTSDNTAFETGVAKSETQIDGIYVSERLPGSCDSNLAYSGGIAETFDCKNDRVKHKRTCDNENSCTYPSSVIVYFETLSEIESVFFDSDICASHNTTFVANSTHEIAHGIALTNNASIFKASKSIKVAILGKHHVIPDLGSCFLLRTDKHPRDVFVLRVRQNPRRTKIDWKNTVDLNTCVNWKTPHKRRKLSLQC